MLELIVLLLASYGITSLLVYSDGPWDIFLNHRVRYPKSPLTCFKCTAFWVSMLTFIVYVLGLSFFMLPLAILGAVLIIDSLVY